MVFADNSLNTGTTHTYTSAHWVNSGVLRCYSDLGAAAWITGNRFEFNDAVVDFRHFLGKELGEEDWVCSGQEDLRASWLFTNIIDVRTHTVAVAQIFTWDNFIASQNCLGAAKVNSDVTVLNTFDQTGDDLAFLVFKLFVLALAL